MVILKNQEADFRELVIFPGVEISAGTIHLLAIFPEETKENKIVTLLGKTEFRADSIGVVSATTLKDISSIVKDIKNEDGIAIPAHASSPKGLFNEKKGNELEKILEETKDKILAVEITDNNYIYPQIYTDKKIKWTRVLGSDSHHATNSVTTDIKAKIYTWVKMSKPTFEGLKLALTDGILSVICSDMLPSINPNNEHGGMMIESIKIHGAKYVGVFNEFECVFNPWLNVLIGGRGSSKSTILEFVRLGLSRADELPKYLKESNKMYLGTATDDSNLYVPNKTNLEIFYRNGDRRIKVAIPAGGTPTVENEDPTTKDWMKIDDNWERAVKKNCPIKIFSQKEIFELARDPQALLKLIDRYASIGYDTWLEDAERHKNEYLSLILEKRKLIDRLKEKAPLVGELEFLKKQIEYYETQGAIETLRNYKKFQDKKMKLRSGKNPGRV